MLVSIKGDDILAKNNTNRSLDKPYIPARDPRDVNVVDRIKRLQNKDPIYVNDESLEHSEVTKVIATIIEKEIPVGTPGGFVKLNDSGLIDPSCLPPSAGGSAVYTARTHYEFPTVGVEDMLYIATTENSGKGYIYRWCDGLHCYERPDDDLGSVSEIYGGSAEII